MARISPPPKKGLRLVEQHTTLEPVAALTPHPRNVNRGDLGAIHESIIENGFYGTIVAQQGTGFILAGNHRYAAALEAGASEVPVTWVDVDDERALKILLADNRTTRVGHDDDASLADLLQELADGPGLEGTGYDGDDLDELLASLAEKPKPPPDGGDQIDRADEHQRKWRVALGQLWLIPSVTAPGATHRIVCGDSGDPATIERLLDGATISTLVFDPPWDAGIATVLPALPKHALVFTDGRRLGQSVALFGPPTWLFVWDGITSWYTPNRPLARHKSCLWYGPLDEYAFDGAHYGEAGDAKRATNTRGSYDYEPDARGKHLADVFSLSLPQEHARADHPHAKPLDWVRLLLGNCTSGLVHDPFLGGGTTLIACEQLGRACYGMELEPKFVAATLERAALTGLEPRLAC